MRTLCLLLLFSMALFHATAQPGSLDPSFGNKGIQTTPFLLSNYPRPEYGRAVLTNANRDVFVVLNIGRIVKYLPDGRLDSTYGNNGYSDPVALEVACATMQGDKIVVAGSTGISPGNAFALFRYTADGTLDHSFGVNGEVTTGFDSSDAAANAIALQGDKILVAGSSGNSSGNNFALTRYTADGTLDTSFGVNGRVTTDLGGDDNANAIVVQRDKIVVAGYTTIGNNTSDFALARYTTNGTLDATFGVNGTVTTDFNNSYDEAHAIALQDDKIIAAGRTFGAGSEDFALARYTTDGILDSAFGVKGKVTTDFNNHSNEYANAIVLQGDKILVVGNTAADLQSTHDFALARYTADGTLDATFGVKGKATTDFGGDDYAYAIALQGSKIIAVGNTAGNYPGIDFALARYTTDGALDPTFGQNGKLIGFIPVSQLTFTSTALQDSKIVVAGSAGNYPNVDFALVRYTTSGALDASFGENGKVTTDFNSKYDAANAIALQGDKIVAAGSTYNSVAGNYDFALARYTADGTLDTSFGVNGKVITVFYDGNAFVNAITLQGDKILAAGYLSVLAEHETITFFRLDRYTTDGRLDSSFGDHGTVITDFGVFNGTSAIANAIALQGNRILLAGGSSNGDFALARYTANGKLDSSFGVNGLVTTSFGVPSSANAIALQNNKIIVAGNSNGDFAIARYTADGTLDATFGVNGIITTDFNNNLDDVKAAVLQDNKIIAAGSTYNFSSNTSDFALARYTADGRPDSSFGVNGKVTTSLDGSASIQGIAVHENRLYAVGSLSNSGESYGVAAAYQLENPQPTEPSISIADVTVCESQKQAVLTIQLSAPSTKVIRVYYQTHYKTAYTPQDYIGGGAILYIPAGTTTATIKIPIVNDSICEPTEQFEVLLRNACHATLKDSIAIVTIKDDDCTLMTTHQSTAVQADAQVSTSLHITASPNPATDAFTVQLQGSNLKQQVSIRVYDMSGRLLEQREHLSIGQILRLCEQYKAGTYIIEAVQGSRRVQTKVIKTGK